MANIGIDLRSRTNGLQHFVVAVDDEDLALIEASGPWLIFATKNNRCKQKEPLYYAYRRVENGRFEYLHRFVASRLGPIPCKMQVDHIDRNSLNNRRTNLRVVTPSENLRNRRKK